MGSRTLREPPKVVRLVAREPEQLRRREARHAPVRRRCGRGREARALSSSAFGQRAAVVPEDRRAEHRAGGIEEHGAVHLAGESDRRAPAQQGPAGAAAAPSPRRRPSTNPSGSCSDHAGCGREIASGTRGRCEERARLSSTSTALTAEVPMSRPANAINGAVVLGRLLGAGHEGDGVRHGVLLRIDDAEPAPSRWMWMRSATSKTCGMLCEMSTIGRPRALHVEDQLEHAARFLDAERRRRLVHDDDLGAEGGGARHRHALALAAGQGFHRLVDVLDGHQAEFGELVARDLLPWPARSSMRNHWPSEPGLRDLAAEEHVVGDRQRRRQREVLVDRLDAGVARLHGRAELARPCPRA